MAVDVSGGTPGIGILESNVDRIGNRIRVVLLDIPDREDGSENVPENVAGYDTVKKTLEKILKHNIRTTEKIKAEDIIGTVSGMVVVDLFAESEPVKDMVI